MNGWRITVDDVSSPEIAELIAYHVRTAHAETPVENAFALGLEALRHPDIMLWTLWEGAVLLGCAALKDLGHGVGELKSMRTAPAHLRRGVAAALLSHIIGAARDRGFARINMETGTSASFAPARALYHRFGFAECGPYGDYPESAHNRYMTLNLLSPD